MPKVTVICYTRSQPWGHGHHPRVSRMQQRIRVNITRPLISTHPVPPRLRLSRSDPWPPSIAPSNRASRSHLIMSVSFSPRISKKAFTKLSTAWTLVAVLMKNNSLLKTQLVWVPPGRLVPIQDHRRSARVHLIVAEHAHRTTTHGSTLNFPNVQFTCARLLQDSPDIFALSKSRVACHCENTVTEYRFTRLIFSSARSFD